VVGVYLAEQTENSVSDQPVKTSDQPVKISDQPVSTGSFFQTERFGPLQPGFIGTFFCFLLFSRSGEIDTGNRVLEFCVF
jgi:hypothetical protein